ncbi:hypothetical protein QBC37DRAFT_301427, partial [Rhypophila decipiens]
MPPNTAGRPSIPPVECTVCGKPFSRKNELGRHRRNVHAQATVKYSCTMPRCSSQYGRPDNLLKHMR